MYYIICKLSLLKAYSGCLMQNNYLPRSVAIIPDGNRRWAKSHKLQLMRGYDIGINKAISVSLWLNKLGIKELSIWALSTENVKNRSKDELKLLYSLYKRTSTDPKVISKFNKNNAKVVLVGDLKILPADVRRDLRSLEKATSKNNDLRINLMIGYGGQEELVHAVKRLLADRIKRRIKTINESIFRTYLRSACLIDPDLIIRTSGEMRLSGFLPWQSAYSELYFVNKYWPDFNEKDLKEAIEEYSRRSRRYGK